MTAPSAQQRFSAPSDSRDADATISALAAEVEHLRAANAELQAALHDMEMVAQRDALTGLYNRRYFLGALHDRIARVSRYQERVAIVYVDVDGLKAVNDRWGHAAGDKVLVAIAATLRSETRESDVVARIGGDEFALLIDHIDAPSARSKMRALRKALMAADCVHQKQRLSLSAAFGMAMIDPRDTADDLISRADRDMYEAKRAEDDLSGRPPGA